MAKISPILLPMTAQHLQALGENLKLARKRRRISSTLMAQRANLSRSTLMAIEQGQPQVSMGAYVRVLQVLGMAGQLAQLAAHDELGRKLQDLAMQRHPKPPSHGS